MDGAGKFSYSVSPSSMMEFRWWSTGTMQTKIIPQWQKITGKTHYFETWKSLWSYFRKIKTIFKNQFWALVSISFRFIRRHIKDSIRWISRHFWKPSKNQSTCALTSMSKIAFISSCHLLEGLWFWNIKKLSSLQTSMSVKIIFVGFNQHKIGTQNSEMAVSRTKVTQCFCNAAIHLTKAKIWHTIQGSDWEVVGLTQWVESIS